MSFKVTGFLLALLVLFAGGAYMFQAMKAKEAKEPPKYVYKFPYEDIVEIKVELPDKSLHIKQQEVDGEQRWFFVGDNTNQADTLNASNLQPIMSGPAYERAIAAEGPLSEERAAGYGLAKPSIVATITTKDGTTHRVMMGDKSPDGKYYYTRNAGSDTIYLVDQVWGEELVRVVNNPPVAEEQQSG